MKKLALSKDLWLPVDAVTQTFLVVGKRGSGKSNTAARLVEQMHHVKLPFVVLDPVDTWWGLKASADGTGPGLDVYVFGGRKADLPLEPGAGALIAEVLCEHRISMVLSVKHLSGRERNSFMVAFAQTLFQKWQGGPLHVVLEEAHELAPQMSGGPSSRGNQDNEAAMLGAFKRLWKLGRSSGIGGTAVTQRPASLSKDITTQSEILIAHRTIGPQDVKAIGEWVKYHGQHEQILGDLPTLPTGEAFVWAPEFPADLPIGLTRTTVRRRDTFDSASTPKVGETRVEPKQLADVDLERLRTQMAATIERAKADDPKELKKQLAEANRMLARGSGTIGQLQAAPVKGKDVPVLSDPDRALIEKLTKSLESDVQFLHTYKARAHEELKDTVERALAHRQELDAMLVVETSKKLAEQFDKASVKKLLEKLSGLGGLLSQQRRPSSPPPVAKPAITPVPQRTSSPRQPAALSTGERATLTAALTYPDGVDRKRLSVLTGYKRSSRDAYIVRLRQKGLITVNGQFIRPTDAGADTVADFQPLPSGQALVDYWRQRLPEGERRTLDVLLETQDDTARELIDEATGYKRSSRDAYLVRLKARGLVEFVGRGRVRASAELLAG